MIDAHDFNKPFWLRNAEIKAFRDTIIIGIAGLIFILIISGFLKWAFTS